MSDTMGGLIDKLFTIDTKMWNNQEMLYKIRKMEFNDFLNVFCNSKESKLKLYKCLKKACDLNIQRNQLIDEIDEKIIEMIKDCSSGKNLDNGKYIQRKHKTI